MAYLVQNDRSATYRRAGAGMVRTRLGRCSDPVDEPITEEPLADFLEGSILPRLMVAHGLISRSRIPADDIPLPETFDVGAMVSLAVDAEPAALLDHVDALLLRGLSIDSLFVDLMAPAARRLGMLWDEDRCDFIEVTMALWRLQEVVRELAARFPRDRASDCGSRRALFAAMPGEQHSFGTVLIEETFRREGWKTEALFDPSRADVIERVAADWFDVVGLTVSRDCNIEPLPHLIHALRSVARNPRMIVMVGGRVFLDDPSLAAVVGADGTAADAVQAVVVAGGLVHAIVCEAAASA